MTSETNRTDPLLPPGSTPAINADDPTQPAFPTVAPVVPGTTAPAAQPSQPAPTAWTPAEPWPTTAQPSQPAPTAWTPAAPGPSQVAPTPAPAGTLNPTGAVWTPPSADPNPATAGWAPPVSQPPTAATSPWAPPQQVNPFPASPASPAPASAWIAQEQAPAPSFAPAGEWAAVPPAAYAAKPARAQGGIRPLALAIAIIGTAVLTAGTTYVAVEATHPAAATNQLAAAQPSGGTGATTTPGGQGTGSANPIPANGQASIPEIVKAVSPATVTITAEGVTSTDQTTGQATTGTAVGSGVIFDASGLVLTNHHVVAGNPSKLTVTLKDGRTLPAEIYGVDTLTDLAIVKIDGGANLPVVAIGSSAGIQVGQQAIAIGSPLGDLTGSVTSGIISALGRQIDAEGESLDNLIQTDTPINPGNSGGPLLDAGGNVIGINTAVSTGAQNIGFAIPIDIAKPLLAQASAGQPLARAWLGIRFRTIDPTLQTEVSLPVASGAWIPSAAALEQLQQSQGGTGSTGSGNGSVGTDSSIVSGSPAQSAGLAEGDIITAIDGTTLDATHTLDLLLGQQTPGKQVTLSVLRNGTTTSITVTLGTRPQSV